MGRRGFIFVPGMMERKLKILMYGPGGHYIGGDRPEPQFIAGFSDASFNSIDLLSITATGPGPDDWIVSGEAENGSNRYGVFYGPNGFISSTAYLPVGSTLQHFGGHFVTLRLIDIGTTGQVVYQWITATATGNVVGATADFDFGYVLPNVLTGGATRPFAQTILRQVAVLDPTLSHAISLGEDATGTTNPNLFFSGGGSVKLSQDLNAAIPRSDLVWPNLYVKDRSFYFADAFTADGIASLGITPYTIGSGGSVTPGTAFTIGYQENVGFEPIDASYYPG